MTSGLATYDDRLAFLNAYAAGPTTDFTTPRLLAFADGIPLQSGYHYTNTGYTLAEI